MMFANNHLEGYYLSFLTAVRFSSGQELAKEIGRLGEEMIHDPRIIEHAPYLLDDIEDVIEEHGAMSMSFEDKVHAVLMQMQLIAKEIVETTAKAAVEEERKRSLSQMQDDPLFGLF